MRMSAGKRARYLRSGMLERIESSFKDLLASLQTARLYGTTHPLFDKAVDKAYLVIQEILAQRSEITFGIVGEEIAFEKEIFFELSKVSKPVIVFLKSKGVERIAFFRGLAKSELFEFVEFLALPREEAGKDPSEYLLLHGIKNISVGKLMIAKDAGTGGGPGVSVAPNVMAIFKNNVQNISQSIANVIDTQTMDQMVFRFAINSIMENLTNQYQEFLKLITLRRYDMGTYAHLLNVSILVMHFASKIGLSKEIVLEMGIAGLFHDIGKMYISRKIIRKPDRLTEEEFLLMKSHTVLGAELLLDQTEALGVLPVVVAFEHHLKHNLKGYPKINYLPKKPHMASMIVSICDVYDALSERRGYKTDYPPDMIYNIIMKEKGSSFDPWLVDKFFQAVGVWPIGSIVALTDDRIGVVVDENESDIFSPKVEVLYPEATREILDLRSGKSNVKIARYLNPWTEGKKFLHLVGGVVPESN